MGAGERAQVVIYTLLLSIVPGARAVCGIQSAVKAAV